MPMATLVNMLRNFTGWSFVVGVATFMNACNATRQPVTKCAEVAATAYADTLAGRPDLSFVACPLEVEYSPDSVEVFIGVMNTSKHPQVVRISTDLFGSLGVWVESPEGREIEPRSYWEPLDIEPDRLPEYRHLLPEGGVVGRQINLSCGTLEYGADLMPECLPLYDFGTPGIYEIRVQSAGTFLCPAPCRPEDQVVERQVQFPAVKMSIRVR